MELLLCEYQIEKTPVGLYDTLGVLTYGFFT